MLFAILMNLEPLTQSFVLHFGEIGSRWGINSTVGQIYALLFVAKIPFNPPTSLLSFPNLPRANTTISTKELKRVLQRQSF